MNVEVVFTKHASFEAKRRNIGEELIRSMVVKP